MSRRHAVLAAGGVVLLVAGAACSDSGSAGTTAVPSATSADQIAGSDSADAGDAALPTGDAAPPTGEPLIEGLSAVVVLGPPSSGAGDAPQFRWEPVATAASYDLVVLGSDGPLWAWQGEETEVWLGGLPFERPPGVAGPVLDAGSCWSVVARDAAGHVIAASAFLAVSPAESAGQSCTPLPG